MKGGEGSYYVRTAWSHKFKPGNDRGTVLVTNKLN